MKIKKNKIVYFIQVPPPITGVSKLNEIVYNSNIINHGRDKYIVKIDYSSSLSEINEFRLIKVYKYFKNFIVLTFLLISKKPDILYYTIPLIGKTFYKEIPFILVVKMLHILPVYHLHGKGIAEKIFQKPFLIYLYRFTFNNSAVIHLSDQLALKEINPLKLSNSKIYIVENGVEKNDISFSKVNEKLNLLFFSNIEKSKGIFVLLESLSMLSIKYPQIFLNVLGDFRYENEKKIAYDYIIQHNLQDKIHFWGQVTSCNKYKLIIQNDIFVYPTLNDAFPLVILEAIQCSLPVISTFEGAIPEIVDDGITGLLVEKNNSQALTEKIEILINNPDQRRQMGEAGKKKFLEKYTLDIFEKNMKTVFDDILK